MRTLLTIAAALLALGPGAAGATAQYPATASFSASDSPDLWNAAGGGSSAAIALGGTVSFDVATSEPHDASFPGGAGVACTAGGGPASTKIPSTPSASWSGTCTFSQPGYVPFVCTVHTDMTGEVAVAGADGTLPPRQPPPPPPPPSPPAPAGPNPAGGPPPGFVFPPPVVSLTPVFELDRTQRGTTVRGTIAGAGAGATATFDLTARKRDLSTSRRKPTGTTRLRRLTRTTNATGSVTAAISLPVLARRALLRRGRLALTLSTTVRGPSVAGGSAKRTQQVTLLAPSARLPAAPRTATVGVRDNFFTPRTVAIRKGGSVTWSWGGGERAHNVSGPGFESTIITAGTYRRTFSKTGLVRYVCTLHDGMAGTITVR